MAAAMSALGQEIATAIGAAVENQFITPLFVGGLR